MSVGERRQTPGMVPGHAIAGARGRFASPALSRTAWAAVGATVAFIALSCWWLSRDRAMPYSDAAVHLITAFRFHDRLSAGDWLAPFTYDFLYAPLTPFVGALGIFVGGRSVAAPILAENLVYVPLLALGCYHTAQRAFGPPAGALAVVFALGSPLIAEQFHVLMLDAPLAALVATTVWLLLASDRLRRRPVALAAGLVAGLGLISKQSFPLYVVGLLAVMLLRGGGWRNWRGLACFLLAAVAIAGPWYGYHASSLGIFTHAAGPSGTVPPLARPPLLSSANAEWYFWALANGLLFVPLLAFATIGVASATVRTARHRATATAVPELLGGLAGAWLAITLMPHHDVRYTLPLIVYLAVLGTGWIARARPPIRAVAATALGLAVAAATLGATFGVGPRDSTLLPANREAPHGVGVPPLHHLTVYANRDYMVSGPRDAGDVLGLMQELRREGVRGVVWSQEWAPQWYVDFNEHGLFAFAKIARLSVPQGSVRFADLESRQAVMLMERKLGDAPPCVRLSEGRGVWIRLGNPWARHARDFCPRFEPHVYG